MPSIDHPISQKQHDDGAGLSFPPVTRDHIFNCSYDQWYPKFVLVPCCEPSTVANHHSLRYHSSCLPSSIIPLTAEFVDYLNEDGIVLADDEDEDGLGLGEVETALSNIDTAAANGSTDADSHDGSSASQWRDSLIDPQVRDDLTSNSAGAANVMPPTTTTNTQQDVDSDSNDEPPIPPNGRFPAIHAQIKEAIDKLGGAVVPKLNWSAPKDAAWISQHQNTLKCTSPNDVYVLLKSSSFVSHDLDHAFEDCITPGIKKLKSTPPDRFRHVLVLRPYTILHTAMEFRCFVKLRTLVGATPRDLNYYAFLRDMRADIMGRIDDFFERKLRDSFPDDSFVFDVYIPQQGDEEDIREKIGRVCLIDINPWAPRTDALLWGWEELLDYQVQNPRLGAISEPSGSEEDTDQGDDDEDGPELRLVEKNDPAAYNFSSASYSAHKLPKDVVDASASGNDGMQEFLSRWREIEGNKEA